jgi:hypothetical protein
VKNVQADKSFNRSDKSRRLSNVYTFHQIERRGADLVDLEADVIPVKMDINQINQLSKTTYTKQQEEEWKRGLTW